MGIGAWAAVWIGLTASVWTRDIDTAMRLTNRIKAGYVWVNDSSDHYLGAPFGGVKSSGLGREECLDELLAYTEQKTVTIVPSANI
ncbi:MAG: aldehyde dehydrogenase family protein [Magnetospiraceae bacterium]